MPTQVNCPTCGKKVQWSKENQYRPFCSERCQMIDLGAWATEEYRVPENQEQDNWSEPSAEITIRRDH